MRGENGIWYDEGGEITMEISPTSASRWWRKDEVGAEPDAEDLKGVRGGGGLVDDIVRR